MSTLCIYHGGCTDGVAAAYAVWKKHPEWKFYPGVYQEDPPSLDDVDKVYLVDFSYKRLVLERMDEQCDVVVLDHHKTAEADLGSLMDDGVIAGVFDMSRCGAMIAWEWFHPAEQAPWIFEHIDARDRWLDVRPAYNDQIIMALRSHSHAPYTLDRSGFDELFWEWERVMATPEKQLVMEGSAIHRYFRQRVDEAKLHARMITIRDYDEVPCVNTIYALASEVAGELAEDSKHGIAAVYWTNKDGSTTFSLRSRGEVDVGDLAVQLGGGGHPGAAGFRIRYWDELS